MKKICHLTSAHGRYDVRIFEKECVSLAAKGYEVSLVVNDDKENEIAKGVSIISTGYVSNGRIDRMLFSTRQILKKALEIDADIYHFHDPELIPCAIKLKKRNKKIIFDSHENCLNMIVDKNYIPMLLRLPLAKIYNAYLTLILKKMDTIISVDPHICESYKKLNENVIMVTNYPIYNEIEGNVNKKRTICFAGGIDEQWNHEYIIQSIADIQDMQYVLCGNAETDYLERLKQYKGWEKVDYRGLVSHREVLDILKSSSIGIAFCSYSRNTNGVMGTLGNTKLFEIMMAGLPVICTDFTLWKNIIEKNKCGFCIKPNDINVITNTIQYIFDNPKEAIRMGINGREAIKSTYNWDVEKEKLLELYAKI